MAKFKFYTQDQPLLLPHSLESKVPLEHISRVINKLIDEFDTSKIESTYSGMGCRAYHPKILLKILIYGYSLGIRSSRKLASMIKENLIFMWLSGMQEPDFRTINDFRKSKLDDIDFLFNQLLTSCVELGLVKCGKVFLDGTKLEANSSSNRMEYRKTLEKRKTLYSNKVAEILKEAEEVDKHEDELYGDHDGTSLEREYSDEEIRRAVNKVEKKRKQLDTKKEKIESKLEDIDSKLDRMGDERNSYGKTDKDSTRMKMKEGYTAPGYNIQMGSENQIIVGYKVSQKCNDSHELIPMMEVIKNNLGKLPKYLVTDKGYGTQSNYEYLEKIEYEGGMIPHQYYDIDRIRVKKGTYELGKNPDYERLKLKMIHKLNSEKGQQLLKRRKHDIEPVFGDIKHNMNFRKLLLKGLDKVNIEIGLIAMAHNIKKITKQLKNNVLPNAKTVYLTPTFVLLKLIYCLRDSFMNRLASFVLISAN